MGKALDRHWERWGGRIPSLLHLSKEESRGGVIDTGADENLLPIK